ncbi:MAG: alkaline phosphatase [Acidobacteria bacterium]|nr:alkaline phosphatase [Acidobacteriota bacterium]
MKKVITAVALSLFTALTATAATITVTSLNDGVGIDGLCSIREAILAANTNVAVNECTAGTPGHDDIAFNIISGSGVRVIPITGTSLPPITDPVTIDGTTQPGFSGTPVIQLRGPGGPGAWTGLTLVAGANTIRGLDIFSFSVNGISIRSSFNTIAGNIVQNTAAEAPIVSLGGILIDGSATAANDNVIGGTVLADRNYVVGNQGGGIRIVGGATTPVRNSIIGNFVGIRANGTIFGNYPHGIELVSAGTAGNPNTIGGTAAAASNLIGGNGNGIHLQSSTNTIIQGNRIGDANASLQPTLGNDAYGVLIDQSSNNTIGAAVSGAPGGNRIAGNNQSNPLYGSGVRINSGTGNSILTNSFVANTHAGDFTIPVDLGPIARTPNDACDPDSGANNLQNSPTVLAATISGGMLTFDGYLDSLPNATYTLEFYAGAENGLYGPDAATFLGNAILTTGSSCTVPFHVTFPQGSFNTDSSVAVSATNANGDTSEFDEALVSLPFGLSKAFTPSTIGIGGTSQLTITLTNESATPGGVTIIDALPAGLTGVSATVDCGGGSTPYFSGNTLNAFVALPCVVRATVTSNTAGSYTNSIPVGSVVSNGFVNVTGGSATLVVTSLAAPVVTKTFAGPQTGIGISDRLTITLTNPNASPLTGAAFADTYPANLVNATQPNAVTTCGGTLTASASGGFVTLSGGTIPASGSCTVSVDLVSNTAATYTNTIAASGVTTANGVSNTAPATATVVVVTNIPALSPIALLLVALALIGVAVIRLRV